jgi:flavin-dependent thymidylate synthase
VKRVTDIKLVKPKVWNFEIVNGSNAWQEVVYSARVSGVPSIVKDRDVFMMMVDNDYGSALEHIILKFDIKITKGNAPEFLEHRIMSHTGYSTRYIKADRGIDRKTPRFEIILPLHLLKDGDSEKEALLVQTKNSIRTYEEMLSKKVPKEVARYALPFAIAAGIYHVTINLRSLLNLLSLRLCVRTAPEFRCLASQLYFNLTENLPLIRGLVGCRGFMRGACPESGVTGVRTGKQHSFYPVCHFKNPTSSIYIPTKAELRETARTPEFDLEKAIDTQERIFRKWAKWE